MKHFFSLFLLSGYLLVACQQADPSVPSVAGQQDEYQDSRVKATATPAWDEMLRRNAGWIGADGVYAVPLNGVETPGKADETETLFWFSDDIWGTIQGDTLTDGWEMANNCVAYLKGGKPVGDNLEFFRRQDDEGKTLSMFVPRIPEANPGEYYWLGDGFFNHALDSSIYIFAYRIKNVPGSIYPFDDVGLSLIVLPSGSRPPFDNQRQLNTPFFLKDSKGKGKLVMGAAVLANTVGAGAPDPDGFIYVYGLRGPKKELIVGRVQDAAFENFSEWRFWNGSDWVDDIHACAALTDRVSNEMSVSFMEDGRVIAAYQLDTNSPDVVIQVGHSPVGPFHPRKKVWSTPEIYDDVDFYTYNAKAHPHLSQPGELLISYNVNSFDFAADIKAHPWHLRPRFFTVKY